jgi:general secretion pathway protein D
VSVSPDRAVPEGPNAPLGRALRRAALLAALTSSGFSPVAYAQDTTSVRAVGDSVTVRFADADLRAVVQALGRHLDRPVLFANLPGARVTLETPWPVARTELPALLRGLLEGQNLELVRDSSFYRVRPREPLAQMAGPQAVPTQADEQVLTVVRLRHARAADIAATLSALYGARGGDLGGGARRGTLSEELRRNVVPPYDPSRPSAVGREPSAEGGTRSAILEGAITIVPDPFTNALLIRATARDAELLRQAIHELDLRPLQVLIEVVIVEARRDRQLAFGTDLALPPTGVGRGNVTLEGTQQGGGLGDFVLRIMNLGKGDLDAVLRAGASRGDVEILSRPVLLSANNHEARILVGSQRPFIQVSRSLPTETPTRDQVVQYKDVGTRLTVRPTISGDGYVTLEVVQEVNSATSETAFDAPVISTREVSTQVLVRDGQTIVLGGLVDRQRDVTSGGVPVLSAIPLLGGLFGRQSRRTAETELFLFLTPRVLRTDEEVEGATRDYRERAPRGAREAVPPRPEQQPPREQRP